MPTIVQGGAPSAPIIKAGVPLATLVKAGALLATTIKAGAPSATIIKAGACTIIAQHPVLGDEVGEEATHLIIGVMLEASINMTTRDKAIIKVDHPSVEGTPVETQRIGAAPRKASVQRIRVIPSQGVGGEEGTTPTPVQASLLARVALQAVATARVLGAAVLRRPQHSQSHRIPPLLHR